MADEAEDTTRLVVPVVPDPEGVFAPQGAVEADEGFPSWRYGPEGEADIFFRSADVPKGWKDAPFTKLADDEPKEPKSELREQLKASVAAFDHDGDGKPGGSKPKAKAGARRARK